MRITHVTGIIYRQAIRHRPSVSASAGGARSWHETLLVRVDTDTGLTGWGEGFGHGLGDFTACHATRVALETMVEARCIGQEVRTHLTSEIARALHAVSASGPLAYALSGLDIALWDLHGKQLGQPLHALLGGATRHTLPAYASLMRYANSEVVEAECCEAVARGYRAIKVHEIEEAHISAAAAVCRAHHLPLMVDANCAWTLSAARRMAHWLSALDVEVRWLEEPLWPPEDGMGLRRLRDLGPMALATGENAASPRDLARLIALGAVDHVQPSVTRIGGIGVMRELIEQAHAAGLRVAPHSAYFGPGLLATLHLCAALVPEADIEHLFYDLEDGPFGAAVCPVNGVFTLPTGPGLGVDPDLERLAACEVKP